MPALVLLGRRWRVASDDFFYVGICYSIIGLIWVCIFAWEIHAFPDSCNDPMQLKNLLVAFVVVTSMSVFVNIIMTWLSSRGTIMNGEPRQHINLVLYARAILSISELVLTVKACAVLFNYASECVPVSAVLVVKGAAVIFSFMLALKLFNFLLAFDSHGKMQCSALTEKDDAESMERAYMIWRDRCKLLTFCCIWESNAQKAFEDVARIFASFFGDMDLVGSDVFAGLILLYRKYERFSLRDDSIHEVPAPSWMTTESAIYFLKYAEAMYGWPAVVVANPCCWICQLARNLSCCLCCLTTEVVEDDPCGCQLSTVLLLTGLKQEDIVHVSFHNRVYQVPFLVGLDHETKSVVVSIRGSITLRDMLTDMSADCDPLANDIGLPNVVAHRGMLKTAQYVQEQLEKGGYLQEAFGFHPDYDLVLIGHSLGAGVAALLGLLLRNSYPGVKCFLYAPPGGLLSDTAVRQTENFMMTIILGCDWVPRMSLANLDGLKASLLEALATCSTPKYKVLAKAIWKVLFTRRESLEEGQAEDTPMNSIHVSQTYPTMQTPGRILHLVESDEQSSSGKPVVRSYWRNAVFFDRIVVTPKMVTDHIPPNILKALKAASLPSESMTTTTTTTTTAAAP